MNIQDKPRSKLMRALWIAFILAVAWASFAIRADTLHNPGQHYCFNDIDHYGLDAPYMPQAIKTIIDWLPILNDICYAEGQATNYWRVLHFYSLYILITTTVLFALVFLIYGSILLGSRMRRKLFKKNE